MEPLADPAVLEDGACVVCGKPRKLAGLRPLYRELATRDPFCSTECARRWWGTPLPGKARPGRRAYVETLPPAA